MDRYSISRLSLFSCHHLFRELDTLFRIFYLLQYPIISILSATSYAWVVFLLEDYASSTPFPIRAIGLHHAFAL
jgi:hypothetical protein